jgi:Na+/H+ antiporter NhaC
MEEYGALSMVPPILTIIVALYSKNVLFALTCGIFSGSLIIVGFNPFAAVLNVVENQILEEISSGTQVQVILTIFVIGGFVKLLEVSGGAGAFARKMTSVVTSGDKAQLLAWLTGIGIFFTDSGNSLIVGPLYRTLFDEFKICREKLAYILDTTSSPISILIPFIGWGAYIMSLIERSYFEIGLDENAFSVLINVIPYQFYAFLALASVPVIVLSGKEFGPMKVTQAQYDQLREQEIVEKNSEQSTIQEAANSERISIFLYPLGVMLLLVGGLISWHASHGGISGVHIRSTLIIAYISASFTCMEMMRRYQSVSYVESLGIFIKGAESLVYISIVLVLAWSLSSVTQDIHTANYLASIISGSVSPMYFPMIVFVLGALISLSTGSSYGTFAILMAIAVPVAFELNASMYLTIAAVLSGGLFGDHVSPISDTTVLASAGAECSHLGHVTTQGAYAGVTGFVALIAYGAAGVFESPLVLPLAIVALIALMNIMLRTGNRPVVNQ